MICYLKFIYLLIAIFIIVKTFYQKNKIKNIYLLGGSTNWTLPYTMTYYLIAGSVLFATGLVSAIDINRCHSSATVVLLPLVCPFVVVVVFLWSVKLPIRHVFSCPLPQALHGCLDSAPRPLHDDHRRHHPRQQSIAMQLFLICSSAPCGTLPLVHAVPSQRT